MSVWQEKAISLSRLHQLLLIRCASHVLLPLSDGQCQVSVLYSCRALPQLVKAFSKIQITSLLCPLTTDVTLDCLFLLL